MDERSADLNWGLEMGVLPWIAMSRLTRFNAALKRKNDSRSHGLGGEGRFKAGGDDFRKCLWLIIRKVDVGKSAV